MAELELWMRVGQPLEPVLSDLDRTLDAWQSGGVRGLVIGRLTWDDGQPVVTPNATVYRRWDVPAPPDPTPGDPARRVALDRMIDVAKGRGWPVYLFEAADGAGPPIENGRAVPRRLLTDEAYRRAYLARLEDVITQFPQADGVILDGPEWGYEIAPGHRSNLFDDLGQDVEGAAKALGFDYQRLVAAKDRFSQRLHTLSREAATLGAAGGVFNAMQLTGADPGIASWFAFRQRTMTAFYRQAQQLVEALTKSRSRQVKLGIGPRMPSLSALCGYDFPATAPLFDLILPKMYVWNRGVDGLYGTIYRYVTTLMEWNSGLWEAEAFAATRALLGISLPSAEPGAAPGQVMSSLKELERGFPDAFFTQFMTDEAKRCLAAGDGYAWRVLPWIDGGRRPHGGDPVSAHELRRLLMAAKEGGLRHVLFHNHAHLTGAEWSVLSEYCGYAWRAGDGLYGQYLPPDA